MDFQISFKRQLLIKKNEFHLTRSCIQKEKKHRSLFWGLLKVRPVLSVSNFHAGS